MTLTMDGKAHLASKTLFKRKGDRARFTDKATELRDAYFKAPPQTRRDSASLDFPNSDPAITQPHRADINFARNATGKFDITINIDGNEKASFENIDSLTKNQWKAIKAAFAGTSEADIIGKVAQVALGEGVELDKYLKLDNTTITASLVEESLQGKKYKLVHWLKSKLAMSDLSNTIHDGGSMVDVDARGADFEGAKFQNGFKLQGGFFQKANLDRVKIEVGCEVKDVDIRNAKCRALTFVTPGGPSQTLVEFILTADVDAIKARLNGVTYNARTIFSDDKMVQAAVLEKLKDCSVEVARQVSGGVDKAQFLSDAAANERFLSMSQGKSVHVSLASTAYKGSLRVDFDNGRSNSSEGGFGYLRHYDENGKRTSIDVMETHNSYPLDEIGREIEKILSKRRNLEWTPPTLRISPP